MNYVPFAQVIASNHAKLFLGTRHIALGCTANGFHEQVKFGGKPSGER